LYVKQNTFFAATIFQNYHEQLFAFSALYRSLRYGWKHVNHLCCKTLGKNSWRKDI